MNAYDSAPAEHRAMVDELLADTAKNGGLAPVDLEQFWKDQELSRANPFGDDIPQVPFGAICNWECLFDELGESQDGGGFRMMNRGHWSCRDATTMWPSRLWVGDC